MALRIGLFYTSASLAGAFGGLLARGLSAIGPRGGLDAGWRWILVIEGLLTFFAGVAAYFLLPNSVSTAWFLKPEERELAVKRLRNDTAAHLPDGHQAEGEEKFRWSEVRRGILNIQLWLSASAYFAILSGLYSFGLFLPTIIKGLGYTANEAQLWSVIPYAVAAVVTVMVAFISDRLKLRGVVMLCVLPLAIIGYAVIANVGEHDNHTKYGMTFLMATGLYASVPPVLVWNSNNSAGHYKRATTSGMQLAIANAGGFVSGEIFPTVDKVRGVRADMSQHSSTRQKKVHNTTDRIRSSWDCSAMHGLRELLQFDLSMRKFIDSCIGSSSTSCTVQRSIVTRRGASSTSTLAMETIGIPSTRWFCDGMMHVLKCRWSEMATIHLMRPAMLSPRPLNCNSFVYGRYLGMGSCVVLL